MLVRCRKRVLKQIIKAKTLPTEPFTYHTPNNQPDEYLPHHYRTPSHPSKPTVSPPIPGLPYPPLTGRMVLPETLLPDGQCLVEQIGRLLVLVLISERNISWQSRAFTARFRALFAEKSTQTCRRARECWASWRRRGGRGPSCAPDPREPARRESRTTVISDTVTPEKSIHRQLP